MKKCVIIIFVLLGLMSCTNEDNPNVFVEFDPTVFFNEKLLIAHRGLANDYPENTYESIKAAIAHGFKWIECDIAITKDKIPVLSHDWTIDRCSTGKGNVYDMTYNELLQYDFGSWKGEQFKGIKIPKLIDILKLCKEGGDFRVGYCRRKKLSRPA